MKEIYPKEMSVIMDTPTKTILTMSSGKENKKSQMTFYHLFAGLDLVYNQFNCFKCPEIADDFQEEIIEINYCKRGVYETIFGNDKYLYLTTGEMAANINTLKRKVANMPLGYYEGIGLFIDQKKLKNGLPEMFLELRTKLVYLHQILKANELGIVLRPIKEMIHIFDELYLIDPEKDLLHIKLKVLELLVVFDTIPLENRKKQKKYLDKAQIDKIKQIHQELINNLDKKITIETLAKKYNIGTTSLKICFKEMYGQPVYTYLKDYKIHVSLHLLEETNKNINEIALMLGYDNSSKFSKAFKAKMQCTPSKYRQQKVHLDHERLFGVEIK